MQDEYIGGVEVRLEAASAARRYIYIDLRPRREERSYIPSKSTQVPVKTLNVTNPHRRAAAERFQGRRECRRPGTGRRVAQVLWDAIRNDVDVVCRDYFVR